MWGIIWLVQSESQRRDAHGWATYSTLKVAERARGEDRVSITLFHDGTWKHGLHEVK
jgi:hypothetical protein